MADSTPVEHAELDSRPAASLWRTAWLGALTALPSGLAIGGSYYVEYLGHERLQAGWSWELWILAVVLATPIIGAFWAAGTVWGLRRLGVRLGPTLAGFVGGTLGGVVPMVICVGGFGSLHAPYVGTANVAFGLLTGFAAFAVLHAITPPAGDIEPSWRARALATVLVIAPFGLIVMAAVSLLLPWSVIVGVRDYLYAQNHDAPTIVLVGAMLSAPVLGGILGALLGMVTALSRLLARAPKAWTL